MGQLATRNSHGRRAAIGRAHLTRAAAHRAARTRQRRAAGPAPRFALLLLAALAALLPAALAPATSRAQSGRKPQPTPTPGRPRRAPQPANDLPGQPSTPNAPGANDARRQEPARPAPGAQPSPQNADAPQEIDEDEVYSVDANLVPVSANVSDAAGRAIVDLKLEDFELRVDGQPKPITDLSFAQTPVRLALLFDNSSSIRPTRELEKQAAVRFIRTVLRPSVDQAALFSISTYPSLDQPLTGDASKLVRTVEGYGDVEGSTALFDTIIAAAEYLRPMPGRKVIVIISDGVETTSQITDFGEVMRRSLAADCQVFVIQTGLSENANIRDLTAERRMQDLTASTGGAVYLPKVAAELDSAFAHIAADLSQQYVLSYYPTDDGRDGRFRAISLRVKTRPNVRVRARRGFYPRRRSEASALPPNFVVDRAAGFDEARAETLAPRPSADSRAAAPAEGQGQDGDAAAPQGAARGTLHGSKNLDPETGGVPDERAAASNARPAVRLGNFNPPPARDEPKPNAADAPLETKSQTAATQPSPEDAGAKSDAAGPPKSPAPAPRAEAGERARPEQSAAQSSQQSSSTTRPAQSQATESQAGPQAAKPPVSGGVLNGRAVSLPRPAYPETARRMRAAGMVSVEVTIDEGGKVIAARAISGPTLLREAAVAAARQARFSQTLVSGRPVRVTGVINYTFSM